jgi:hypothetical protein
MFDGVIYLDVDLLQTLSMMQMVMVGEVVFCGGMWDVWVGVWDLLEFMFIDDMIIGEGMLVSLSMYPKQVY